MCVCAVWFGSGASGHGSLLLTEAESFFLRKRDVQALGLKPLENAEKEMSSEGLAGQKKKTDLVLDRQVENETKSQAYQGESLVQSFFSSFLFT